MSSNIQRLGAALSDRMKRTAGAAVPTCLELGAITANLSLVTDGLRVPIPRGEYLVNITLASETYRTSADTHSHSGGEHTHSGGTHAQYTGSGEHTHDGGAHTHSGGEHTHRLPENFAALKAGDRVLVAWCGNEPVVVAVVTAS